MAIKLQPYLDVWTFTKLDDDMRSDIPPEFPGQRQARICESDQDTVMDQGSPRFMSITARHDACESLKTQRCTRDTAFGAAFLGSTMAHAMAITRFLRTGSNMSSADQLTAAHIMAQEIFLKARTVCEPAEKLPTRRDDTVELGPMLGEILEICTNTIVGLETDPEYDEWFGNLVTTEH